MQITQEELISSSWHFYFHIFGECKKYSIILAIKSGKKILQGSSRVHDVCLLNNENIRIINIYSQLHLSGYKLRYD